MIKRAFFVLVLFGVVMLGAVVTSALPTTDTAELAATTQSDTPAPATFSANEQAAIVNSEPIGCKYPDICPPPTDCKVGGDLSEWQLKADDASVLELTVSFRHADCGDDAIFVMTGGPTGPVKLKNPTAGPVYYQCGVMDPPPLFTLTATATPAGGGAPASATVTIPNPQPLCPQLP